MLDELAPPLKRYTLTPIKLPTPYADANPIGSTIVKGSEVANFPGATTNSNFFCLKVG